jgi:hypothetical protein
MSELTQQQLIRQDFVDNEIYYLIERLVPESYRRVLSAQDITWDMSVIAEIREDIQTYIASRLIPNDDCPLVKEAGSATAANEKFEQAFYPYIVEDNS